MEIGDTVYSADHGAIGEITEIDGEFAIIDFGDEEIDAAHLSDLRKV